MLGSWTGYHQRQREDSFLYAKKKVFGSINIKFKFRFAVVKFLTRVMIHFLDFHYSVAKGSRFQNKKLGQ